MEMSTPGNDGKEGKEDAVGWPSTLILLIMAPS